MTEQTAIKILKLYNEWRRGGEGRQPDPEILGEAIDVIVANREQDVSNIPKID